MSEGMTVSDIAVTDIDARGEEHLSRDQYRKIVEERLERAGNLDYCLACGTCASRCPAAGLEGMDPRKFIHMLLAGKYEEATSSKWVWLCSQCKRCQWACPMDIDIPQLVFYARSTWPRDQRPHGILGSCNAALKNEGCSAMNIPKDDWTWVVEDVLEELGEEQPEWAHLAEKVGFDREGAEYYLNQNSREPGHEPEEMLPLWKILDKVGLDWTYGTKGWGAENYCMFLADDRSWEHIVRAKVAAVEELGCKYWLNTE